MRLKGVSKQRDEFSFFFACKWSLATFNVLATATNSDDNSQKNVN